MTPFFVKVCGTTTVDNAAMLVECGVDAIGLNFYPKSARCIAESVASAIAQELRSRVELVGLFVECPQDAMIATAARLGLATLQTYEFTPTGSFSHYGHLPSFRVKSEADLEAIRAYVVKHRPKAVLVDSFVAGQMGGTGVSAPWELLAGFNPGVPWILAGGLTPENVASAIRIARPNGVDVAGGVESRPGVKDRGRVTAFVAAARDVATEIGGSPDSGA